MGNKSSTLNKSTDFGKFPDGHWLGLGVFTAGVQGPRFNLWSGY